MKRKLLGINEKYAYMSMMELVIKPQDEDEIIF